MTEHEREMLAFMARILAYLSRGFPIDFEDACKLDDIARELEVKEENDVSR